MTRSDALNLEAISKAVKQHDERCGSPAIEIAMNPYEVERLDWDEICGLPIVGDDKIPTGRFEVRCERDGANPKVVAVGNEKPVPVAA